MYEDCKVSPMTLDDPPPKKSRDRNAKKAGGRGMNRNKTGKEALCFA